MTTKRVITSVKDFEVWKSTIEGQVWVKQYDRRGDLIETCVAAGKEFRILPEERQFNQELAAEVTLDPFQNGFLVPVSLVESADDYEELKGNPNHLTEQDMRHLLDDSKNIDALKAGMAEVKNPTTIMRLLAIAEDPQFDATLRQVAAIKERLQQVQQQTDYQEIETIDLQMSDGRTVKGSHAAISPAPINPNMGRRQERSR